VVCIWSASFCSLKGWVPNTIFRGGALGKELGPRGSDLIGGLIHWWIHNLIAFSERLWELEGRAWWRK
jgi:hypothetical protein